MIKKNIIFFTGTIDVSTKEGTGGVPKLIINLANEIKEAGLNVKIISCYKDEKIPQFVLNKDIKCEYVQTELKHASNLSIYKKVKFWIYVIKKARILWMENKDAIIISCTPAMSLALIATKRIHKSKIYLWENVNFKRYGTILTGAKKILYKNVEIYITPTTSEYEYLSKTKINSKLILNANYSLPKEVEKKQLPGEKFKLLAIGRMVRQKGFDLLIQSLQELNNIDKKWEMTIIGSGPEENKIKELAKRYQLESKINFVPHCINLDTYYRNADIYVMTSRFEGLPLVLIEAQCFGLPCVSFDCPTGPREVITHGENGLLVELGDVKKIAQEVLRLARSKELYESCSQSAKDTSKKYSPNEVFNKWLEILV
jgi:glycosyltransferase involved in cell wall biosynthesis